MRRWSSLLTPVAVSAAVLSVLLGSALRADEKYALYNEGGLYGGNPFAAIGGALQQVPFFISRGNFRPIGRSIDYIEHSAAYQLAIVTKIPVNVVHGMFRILAVALTVPKWIAPAMDIRAARVDWGSGVPRVFRRCSAP